MMAEGPGNGIVSCLTNDNVVVNNVNNIKNNDGGVITNNVGTHGVDGQTSANGTEAPVPVKNSHGSAESHPHGHPPTLPSSSPRKESEREVDAAASSEVGESLTRTVLMTGQAAASSVAPDSALGHSAAFESAAVAIIDGACCVRIPHEMLPKSKKEITVDHATKWIRYLPFFLPSDNDSSRSIGLDGGTLPPSMKNVNEFKGILESLYEYIKKCGMEAFKKFIVDRFGEEGFKVKGQGPSNLSQCLSIMKNEAVKEKCKKVDPLFFTETLFDIVEGERYKSFKLGGLPLKLRTFCRGYKFPFTWETSDGDNFVGAADGFHSESRKKKQIHNIIQIGISGLSEVRRVFRDAQLESLSMYAREGKAKKIPDDCWIVDFAFDLVPLDPTGGEKKSEPKYPLKLVVKKRWVGHTRTGKEPEPKDLFSLIKARRNDVTRYAHLLALSAVKEKIELPDAMRALQEAYDSFVGKEQGPFGPSVTSPESKFEFHRGGKSSTDVMNEDYLESLAVGNIDTLSPAIDPVAHEQEKNYDHRNYSDCYPHPIQDIPNHGQQTSYPYPVDRRACSGNNQYLDLGTGVRSQNQNHQPFSGFAHQGGACPPGQNMDLAHWDAAHAGAGPPSQNQYCGAGPPGNQHRGAGPPSQNHHPHSDCAYPQNDQFGYSQHCHGGQFGYSAPHQYGHGYRAPPPPPPPGQQSFAGGDHRGDNQ